MISLHPQLAADCHFLFELPECHILLHQNAILPWFILVPKTELTDLLELPATDREAVMDRAAVVSRFIRARWQLPKINFAAIGNMVPQLHLHLIGRTPGDACWPKPVWGNLVESKDYSSDDVQAITEKLSEEFETDRSV